MNTEICKAIKNRNIIEFYYDGGIRIIEPYCYGIHKNTGNEVLRAFQVEGYSESGILGWKFFELKKISRINITNRQFKVQRQEYNPNDSDMTIIYCHL